MLIATILCDKSLSGLSHHNLDIHVLLSVRECDRNYAAGDAGYIDILAVDDHGNDALLHMVRDTIEKMGNNIKVVSLKLPLASAIKIIIIHRKSLPRIEINNIGIHDRGIFVS